VKTLAPLALAASLALAPAAAAKIPAGTTSATPYPHGTICGASHCVSLTGAPLNVLANGTDTYELLAKEAPAPYYRIDIFKSRDYGHRFFWIPSRHVFRVIDGVDAPANNFPPSAPYWRSIGAPLEAELANAVRGLTPRSASSAWR
jgi:hypothetical protein